MIHLEPVSDRETIADYFRRFDLQMSDDAGCVTAMSNDEILGFSLYRADKVMTVLRLSPSDDLLLADGILRSTLHVAVQKGIVDAYYDEAIAEICKKLDFVEEPRTRRLAIGKLFQSCHGCN